eukprot:663770-Pyramimonas_sp.AAC.1
MHFRKYTAVDAKAILDLAEDGDLGSPFLAGFRTWGPARRPFLLGSGLLLLPEGGLPAPAGATPGHREPPGASAGGR